MAGPPTEFEPVPPDVAAHPTVKLPRQRTRPTRRRAPVWLAAAVTTVWAAAVSYLPVLGLVMLLGQVSGGAAVGAPPDLRTPLLGPGPRGPPFTRPGQL